MSTLAPAGPIPEPESPPARPPVPSPWSNSTRIAFRFAFCYLGGYCIFNGNATVYEAIPVVGSPIQYILARVFLLPAQFLAQHLFHVPPPGNQLHPTGSGDSAISWIAVLLLLCTSLIATALWTALDRNRPHYRTLAAWLRFLIRLTVAMGMVTYGLSKVFPLQMGPPAISSLSEPLGMHSPMLFLWDFIGLNPFYEMICGAAELLGGLLLLFRRTALAGALFSAFVVSNVLLYNFFFDVPVKLYAGHLLLLSLFLVLPDAAALFRFFWLHQPAAPTSLWVPFSTQTGFRRAIIAIEIAFAALIIGGTLLGEGQYWAHHRPQPNAGCDLCSAWTIDSADVSLNGSTSIAKGLPSPFVQPAVEFIIDSPNQAVLRNALGDPTYLPIKMNASAHTLELDGPADNKTLFAITQPNPAHLVLTPIGDKAGKATTVNLTNATPPGGYLLLNRGFHWVSEFPYTR